MEMEQEDSGGCEGNVLAIFPLEILQLLRSSFLFDKDQGGLMLPLLSLSCTLFKENLFYRAYSLENTILA